MKVESGLRERLANFLLGENVQQLNQSLAQSEFNNEILQERMVDLELALEDANWMRLMFEGEHEFTRDGLRKIVDLARVMYVKNPLIKRGVMVKALYIWAQGVNVKYKNPELNKILQAFWDDEKNKTELTGHQAQMEKQIDYEVISNIFFVFFVRPSDGRVRVRSLPFEEITEIICDPEDAKSPRFYVRRWTEKNLTTGGRTTSKKRVAYYPDWHYTPKEKPAKIGTVEVMWDTPVYHVKTGGMSGWKFGVSKIYAAIDWARAYKEFLEDVASLMRAYSKFAWKRVTKGGKKAVAAERAKMASTLMSGGSSTETNPAPVTGAMAILGEGTDLQPMQVRGAAISPEDGRRLLLMVAAADGLPETYYGDVSVGTFATAKTMDRPTELAMKEGQTTWTDILRNIFNFVVLQAMKATSPIAKVKPLGKVVVTEDDGMIEERVQWKDPLAPMLDIDFPPILERDIQASVQSIVTALTLNGQQLTLLDEQTATRLILKAIAEDDVDEIMAELFPEGDPSPNPSPDGGKTPQSGAGNTSDAVVNEAARKLLEAIKAEMQKVKASEQ